MTSRLRRNKALVTGMMYRNSITMLLACWLLVACGSGDPDAAASAETVSPPVAKAKVDEEFNVIGKPRGPVRVDYRIIGTPVVGQPVTIDLQVRSNVGDRPVDLTYLANDTTSMSFPESQSASVSLAFVDDERTASQQVTVIPSREGRLFLNVTASLPTETGSFQTVTAIPIQVGSAPRDLTPAVPSTTDSEGNLLREMPADE